jgi:pilus assembly protein Flp/PilA
MKATWRRHLSRAGFVSFCVNRTANHERENAMLQNLSCWVVDFCKKEDGPTAVEYAVMLALIIVVCIAAITTLGSNANFTFTSVGNAVNTTST